MKIIIVGYGRIGTQVVRLLVHKGHSIAILDRDREALEKAPEESSVRVLIGDAVDPDMLRQAGAEKADVLLALTREENTNLMVAQIARVSFKVPKVIAMVYDPQRERSFHAAGVDTLQITVTGAELLAAQIEGRGTAAALELASAVSGEVSKTPERNFPVPMRAFSSTGPYYVIIMGGGRVGYYLGRTLLEEGHEITVVEASPEIYGLVSRQLDCPVIHGDGSAHSILEKAGTSRCDVFVAVTNHDQNNLIGCQVAKREFGVPKTIARVKNPKNEGIMHDLGVDVTVSSTAIISSLIESELPIHKIRTLLNLRVGELEIMEYVLDGKSPVIGRQLKELTMPPHCNIVTILRAGAAVVPRGETSFENNDMVLALADRTDEPKLRKLLLG
ncbi:MAG: NAD-binding protein [Acidobacteria bacterium]|nr:NAD-binding protein [Acidobacteriota bacterium]